ncbi:MAG: MOSC N-terminal beta barrel domain-containing protein [Pseudanabaenaceae cyanobacterium bins.68]|nr:MOSC N-terminal beta barrel domain-containing protein [Pseudanabaenaceae cyanobacterium bins.68]
MQPAYLSQIWIFPIKSLDGVNLEQVEVLSNGALRSDRAYALVDQTQKIINGKNCAQIHQIRASYDLSNCLVELTAPTHPPQKFHLESDRFVLDQWFSDVLGFKVALIHNPRGGFPDDLNAPAATVISTATLQLVNSWFPDLELAEVRRRFRTNLEIDGVSAFAEDVLLSEQRELPRSFRLGSVDFLAINPCQRCIVPSRDSHTGIANPGFQAHFSRQRANTLPGTVARSRFNHFYRLAINTQIHPANQGRSLHIGAPISLI